MKTNKKILLEFLPSITYLLEEAKDLSYREFLDAVNGIVWNVEVSDEIEHSKNLTTDDKDEIDSFLSEIHHYFYDLRNDINVNGLESLDDAVNDLLEYCKTENIEIVYDNEDYK